MNQTRDVTNLLKDELVRRCEKNPKYSLRAFANNLGISPANLSLILNRKRNPSVKTLNKIIKSNSITSFDKSFIKKDLQNNNSSDDNLTNEEFEKINSWKAYAILGLFNTKNFNAKISEISCRTGINQQEIKNLIELLLKANFIENIDGTLKRSRDGLRINNKKSTQFARLFQSELVLKAMSAMENEPFENRDISSITFVMARDKVAIAKEEIRKFRLKMAELFENDKDANDVFSLTVQLAPLTKAKR